MLKIKGSKIINFLMILSLLSCSHGNKIEDEDHSEHHHDHSGLEIHSHEAENLGIITEKAGKSSFREVIKTGGVLDSSTSDNFSVTAKKSGIISLLPEITEGKSIEKGAVIASISVRGVQGGDVTAAANANLEAAKKEYERMKPLFEERLVTAADFREAERAYNEALALASGNSSNGSSVASSPIDGQLTSLLVKTGDYVNVGDPIAIVSKNSQLTLRADLPVRLSSSLGSIETANFMVPSMDSAVSIQNLDGRMISKSSSTVSSNGYIPVYFSFSGNSITYPPGFVEVFLLGREKSGVISVPRSAILEMQGAKYIYVVDNGEDYEKRMVKTGGTDGVRVEILEGLAEGEEYVAKGATSVRMMEVSSVAPPSHSHNH